MSSVWKTDVWTIGKVKQKHSISFILSGKLKLIYHIDGFFLLTLDLFGVILCISWYILHLVFLTVGKCVLYWNFAVPLFVYPTLTAIETGEVWWCVERKYFGNWFSCLAQYEFCCILSKLEWVACVWTQKSFMRWAVSRSHS